MDVCLIVAEWCPQCPGAKTIWRRLSQEFRFGYEEIEIDSAKGRKIAAQFGLRSVPSVIVNQTLYPDVSRDLEQARSLLRHMTDPNTEQAQV